MKFRVSYTIDSGTTTEQEIRDYIEYELDGQDLEIEEIKPKFEAGWYQEKDASLGAAGNEVVYLSTEDLRYMGPDFLDIFQRMNEPTPYEDAPRYKDGYYEMSDGFLYRRVNGRWELKLSSGWVPSEYNDDNIESKSGEAIKRVDE